MGILLQDEHTRASRKIRVILDDDCRSYASNYVAGEYIISSKLVIAVRRNANVAAANESLHPNEGVAHSAACA